MKITETSFDLEALNTSASRMTIGNGLLAIRGVHPEHYENQDRGVFVNGIYNKAPQTETSELVNLPDMTHIIMKIDGERFSIGQQTILGYEKSLNLSDGEFYREVLFQTSTGKKVSYILRRLVSQVDNSMFQSVDIVVQNASAVIEVEMKIDGQSTNHGVQHLIEKNIQTKNSQEFEVVYETVESHQTIQYTVNFDQKMILQAKNRQVSAKISKAVEKEERFHLENRVIVSSPFNLGQTNFKNYDQCLNSARMEWQKFWDRTRIEVGDSSIQRALDFSLYHLNVMSPKQHSELSIGAKGLTGEGYKGHVFWDTEMFMLPVFLHTNPKQAKNLLIYRYERLEGARTKAKMKGYDGALFPWESALSGYEETPEYAAINIRTGKRQKIASGDAEQHISADIAFAVEDYYAATSDQDFMKQYGYTLIEETAHFWISRVVFDDGKLSIKNVIGPDEYTEYVDNDVYTNYMAYQNVQLAKKYNLGDVDFQKQCDYFLENLYLPVASTDGIIPQDDTFLSKKTISLDKYKQSQGAQTILLDYSRDEVNDMQILKQADLIMLFYLFPNLFSKEIKEKNFYYYEERTIHDSSLSKAIHAIEALRLGNTHLAYQFFVEATKIDLGSNPHSSDDGLHAAALASLWHVIIFGFAGVIKGEKLQINPQLPNGWSGMSFPFVWKNKLLRIDVQQRELLISSNSDEEIDLVVFNRQYRFSNVLKIEL